MKTFIFHAEAGHGHKKAAEVTGKALIQFGTPPQNVIIEDALDYAPGVNKLLYIQFYFYCVKLFPVLWGWFYEVLDRDWVYALMKPIRVLFNHMNGSKLYTRLTRERPDVIVSTHFFSAEVAARAKREGNIDAKLITIITDFMPHSLWINEGTDAYWVMHEETKQALINRGVESDKIIAGGIPVDPNFQPARKRAEILSKYGFSENRMTLLITSGSFGIGSFEAILKELADFQEKIQCFVVCGNNLEAYQQLRNKAYSFPLKVFQFVNFMPDLMEASDLMIAKSGGLTTVESLVKGVPMVITQPIPGQETRNADFLKRHEASFFMSDPSQIKVILKNILEHPHILKSKQEHMRLLAKPDAAKDLVIFASKIGAPSS